MNATRPLLILLFFFLCVGLLGASGECAKIPQISSSVDQGSNWMVFNPGVEGYHDVWQGNLHWDEGQGFYWWTHVDEGPRYKVHRSELDADSITVLNAALGTSPSTAVKIKYDSSGLVYKVE